MRRKSILTAVVMMLLFTTTKAQLREVPDVVEQAFAKQYAGARDIDFKDHLLNVKVHFNLKDDKMIATYTNKGVWKESEKEWMFDHFSADVKDGFEKSKYANWNITEAAILYRPNNLELYRVRVVKNEVQKKYLVFNPKGRLLEESITL
ncbi:hypothetical protein [Flavisolibacter tropicus]|uniref:Uncharacterized protein n=1 Tax=Flavisolibacter tropicus TaxID=1492898 RepID=A0A172TUP2_9BACT|nr:hypothetical protein [Flavisolibacter tropicus]ANE50688.1 hypothetical protein SY85_09420 [Flavisolibacter tropicus]